MNMKFLSTVFVVLTTLTGFSQGVSVNEARVLYFSMGKDQAAALKLYHLMNVGKQRLIPVLLAYKGASSAASAGQVKGVYNKYSYFVQGKADMEQAVRLDPKDPEIRFLRLATQTNAPGFLLYKGDIREDKKIVLEGLPGLLAKESDRPVALNIARSLMAFESLTAREKQIVNQLSLRYEQNN
jgi:hypothetical protein